MKRIGFIGLGTMGLPMAKNLMQAGYPLNVYNRTAEKAKPLAELGARVASSPADAAKDADVVFTMLTADAAVEQVILGSNGVATGARHGTLVVDCSTVSPRTSQRIAAELAKLGIEMLDAPVTGSEPQAEQRQLTFMVGGKKEQFERCRPLFDAMGKAAFYMGPSGAGSYTKLANNAMAAINLVALAEAIVMAAKSGIDPNLFLQVVAGGGARSGMAEAKGPKVIARDFRPHFMTELMHKDLKLAKNLADELGLPTPALSVAKEMLQAAIAEGFGKEDLCAVVKCYERWAGVTVGG